MGLFDKFFTSSDSDSLFSKGHEKLNHLDADTYLEMTASVEAEMQEIRNKREASLLDDSIEDASLSETESIDDDFLDGLDDPFEIWQKKVSMDPKADCSAEHEAACDYLEWERARLAEWAEKLGVE